MRVRFDDSLKTVLAADTDTAFGAQSAFRQLVDLIGRRRIPAAPETIERLRALRDRVPLAVRAASARALALAEPGPSLVAFFAEDDAAIVAPVLRIAALDAKAWIALLPALDPAGRSVLRHRRDLPPSVVRALEAFGATDFVLEHDAPVAEVSAVAPPSPPPPEPVLQPTPPPIGRGPFVALGDVARDLPFVAEARRHAEASATPRPSTAPGFEIADLVARIAAFQKDREERPHVAPALPVPANGFRWETDERGVVRWVDGVPRGAVIGIDFLADTTDADPQVDGVVAGAFRRRGAFADGRLTIAGASTAVGSWRVSGVPVFDEASGRFTGFRGTARRPRADETAAPPRAGKATSESLRRLVHELRTPTNAIVGFAELIESQLLGPVAPPYRAHAATIRAHAADLVAAIEDLDTAARIEGGALELRTGTTAVAALLARVGDDLRPLAALRGCTIAIGEVRPDLVALGDDRATERLVARLMSALVSAGGVGETIGVAIRQDGDARVAIAFDRPASLTMLSNRTLLTIDAEAEAERLGAPLLGTGFAIRLAQNLAVELGGALTIDADRLTLRLPAALVDRMGQASTN